MSVSPTDDYKYDSLFYDYIEEGALRSARAIVPLVVEELGIGTVVDVGCGAGAWLSEYQRLGVEVRGIDGEYVDRTRLLIPEDRFSALDVTLPFDLKVRFDLVQCLEVGEHLPRSAGPAFIENLTRHSDLVLFSAAVPGQGGENHVNEQTYEHWRELFGTHGYAAFDFLRSRLVGANVEPWYAYNIILYANESAVDTLPAPVLASRIADGSPIRDVSPLSYRIRKAILRTLPVPVGSRLAIMKHRFKLWKLGRRG